MSINTFDVVVLGGGVACQSIVYRLRDAGRSVAVVDAGPLGGTCANAGCDAKKPYINAAQRVLQTRAMNGCGVTGEVELDWPALVAFKRSFTDPVPGITRKEMQGAGVEVFEGEPRFADAHTIEVNGQSLRGEQIVIATGGKPRPLDIPGAEHTIDSDGFLELDEMPPRVAFVGGGYISMEFAGVAAVAGSKVTVLQSSAYPLGAFEPDAVRVLLAAYADLGIDVLTNRQAASVEKLDEGKGYRISFAGDAPPIEADLVVVAAGRVPSLDGLDLDGIGVTRVRQGIEVDDHLRSVSHDHVWAAGDVAANGRAPLTPTASEDGRVVAHNIVHPGDLKTQITTPIASVAFTLPPIAGVGMSEAQAREHCGPVEVIQGDMARWKHFRQQGEKHAYFKLIFCDKGIFRGGHLVGLDALEVINVLALALGEACNRQTLADSTFGYPTVAFNLISKIKKQARCD